MSRGLKYGLSGGLGNGVVGLILSEGVVGLLPPRIEPDSDSERTSGCNQEQRFGSQVLGSIVLETAPEFERSLAVNHDAPRSLGRYPPHGPLPFRNRNLHSGTRGVGI